MLCPSCAVCSWRSPEFLLGHLGVFEPLAAVVLGDTVWSLRGQLAAALAPVGAPLAMLKDQEVGGLWVMISPYSKGRQGVCCAAHSLSGVQSVPSS